MVWSDGMWQNLTIKKEIATLRNGKTFTGKISIEGITGKTFTGKTFTGKIFFEEWENIL